MRYILYDCRAPKVTLDKEIDHIKNYLELQRLRLPSDANINLAINGDVSEAQVAPLLFIPFIENGFKHGLRGGDQHAYINISFELIDQTLIFKTENSKAEKDELQDKERQGIGIKNTRRRLELLYPQKHELQIIDGVEHFSVYLKLDLAWR